uniref:Si:dkeyp-23e4.3 n=1 Tax=Sinocyclocheilus anshuiensis TaxID=1608454 RepID=A0A671KPW1_9TELE
MERSKCSFLLPISGPTKLQILFYCNSIYFLCLPDCCFPIDIDWVKSDHEFLDQDALDSLCRRLSTLNKCVEIKLEFSQSKRRGDDLFAISPKWSFDRKSKCWIRVDDDELLHSLNCPISRLRRSGSCEGSFTNSRERHELCSTHSFSNADSDGGSASNKMAEEPETSRSSPPSPSEHHILSSEECLPERHPVEKDKSLLRKMEKLRLRGSTLQPHTQSGKARPVISGPIIQEGLGEEKLKHLQCLDLVRLQDKTVNPVSCLSPSQSSSSSLESSSAVSTPSPVTKVRSNCKRHGLSKQEDSQKQINEQHFNNQHNLDVNTVFEIPHGHKPGMFPTVLLHNSTFSPINNTSVSWRTGSFHGYQSRRCKSSSSKDQKHACSPLATCDHRVNLDCVMERICGLQQLVNSWTDKLSEDGDSDFSHSGSPSPSFLTDIHLEIKEPEETNEAALEELVDFIHFRIQRPLWSSAQMLSMSNPSTGIEAKSAPHVSMLQRLSLLRLTALMDKYSPFSKKRLELVRQVTKKSREGKRDRYNLVKCSNILRTVFLSFSSFFKQTHGICMVFALAIRHHKNCTNKGKKVTLKLLLKVEDSYPLRLWRGTTEVDAPRQEVFHRVLREHSQWQRDLLYGEVVETLDKDAEDFSITNFPFSSRRMWQSDHSIGSLFVSSTSVEHATVVVRGIRAQVFYSFFLIEPLGSKKSRVTHLCRTDPRGQSTAWHYKVGGYLILSALMAMKDSFREK